MIRRLSAVLVAAFLATACGGEETAQPPAEAIAVNPSTTGTSSSAIITIQYTPDGTPIYAQNSPLWRSRIMQGTTTIGQAGGALCSVSMCLARFAGTTKAPITVDLHLDTNAGYYSGVAFHWNVAAGLIGWGAQQVPFSLATVDAELDAGRSVVAGVSMDGGVTLAGATGTWVALTSKGFDSEGAIYNGVDAATGEVLALRASSGALTGGSRNYTTTSELVTFTPPAP
jgi:hypothetical protein